MATKEEITAIRTEYASVYDYHSDALVEAMAAVIADTRRAYLAASQTITALTAERDALLAASARAQACTAYGIDDDGYWQKMRSGRWFKTADIINALDTELV